MTLIKAVNLAYGLERDTLLVQAASPGRSYSRRRGNPPPRRRPLGCIRVLDSRPDRQTPGPRLLLHVLWVGLRWPVVFILLVAVVGLFFYVA